MPLHSHAHAVRLTLRTIFNPRELPPSTSSRILGDIVGVMGKRFTPIPSLLRFFLTAVIMIRWRDESLSYSSLSPRQRAASWAPVHCRHPLDFLALTPPWSCF